MPRSAPPRTKPDRRRALELLASCRDGCTGAIMIAHGFTVPQMVELIRAGLASAHSGRMVAGGKPIEVTVVRITEAGRQALAATKRRLFEVIHQAAMGFYVAFLTRLTRWLKDSWTGGGG